MTVSAPHNRVSLHSFPAEVLTVLFSYCTQRSLYSCLFLSSHVGPEAARALYRHARIHHSRLSTFLDAWERGVKNRSIYPYQQFMQTVECWELQFEKYGTTSPKVILRRMNELISLLTIKRLLTVRLQGFDGLCVPSTRAYDPIPNLAATRFNKLHMQYLTFPNDVVVTHNPNMRTLEMRRCRISPDIHKVPNPFGMLEELILRDVDITGVKLRHILGSFRRLRKIELIRTVSKERILTHQNMGPSLSWRAFWLLLMCNTLEELKMEGVGHLKQPREWENPMSTIPLLTSIEGQEITPLRKLELSYSSWISDLDLRTAAGTQRFRNLTHLRLHEARNLGDESALRIAKECKNLTHLDLVKCSLLSYRAIIPIFKNNPQLRVVDLRGIGALQSGQGIMGFVSWVQTSSQNRLEALYCDGHDTPDTENLEVVDIWRDILLQGKVQRLLIQVYTPNGVL
ncbi:hypothetical protein DFS34DRAFT_624077, partial [Phlyctochytrium arcticum]